MELKTEYGLSSTDTDEESVLKEEFFIKEEGTDFEWDHQDNSLSANSKKIIKKRKKYQKIDNETRLKIIEEVQKNGKLLKNVAEKYNVNYSSAKSIFYVYRKEGRVLKKPLKGRNSKTVLHLNNPIVFISLPNNTGTGSQATQPTSLQHERNQSACAQIWQQLPSVGTMTLNGQINRDGMAAPLVSLLHPSSVSMLQNLYHQSITPLALPACTIKDNGVAQEMSEGVIAGKRWEYLRNNNKVDIPQIQNYPLLMQSPQQGYPHPLLMGEGEKADIYECLRKTSLLNGWVQNQMKAIQTISKI